MRFALHISPDTITEAQIELYDAENLSENSDPIAVVVWERDSAGRKWEFGSIAFFQPLGSDAALLATNIAKIFNGQSLSPYAFCLAAFAKHHKQVTSDGKNWRCVSTMVAGKDEYRLNGTTILVDADDAETALRLAKREAASAMADGGDIDAIAAWFKGGCKLTKQSSGALPEYTDYETLAFGEELAEIKKRKADAAKVTAEAKKKDKASA